MTTNTATNRGVYLGKGISPFPDLHAFATNESGSNKSFISDLEEVFEVDGAKLAKKMQVEAEAKASFFSTFPSFTRD
jgi:hypothetical protein